MNFLDRKRKEVQERREVQAAADAKVHDIIALPREIRQYALRSLVSQVDRLDHEVIVEEILMLAEPATEAPDHERAQTHVQANGVAAAPTPARKDSASPSARVAAALADAPIARVVWFVTEHPGVLASEIQAALPEEPHVVERALRDAARNGLLTYRAGAWFPKMAEASEAAKAPPNEVPDHATNGHRDARRSSPSPIAPLNGARSSTPVIATAKTALPAAELPSASEGDDVDLPSRPPTLRMIIRSVLRGQALRMSEIVTAVQRIRPEAKDRSVQGEVYILHRDLKELVVCAYEARGPRYKLARDVPAAGRGEDGES